MKKIKNMTDAEAKEAFTKWEVKHPRHDDFDFNSAQIGNYKELFRLADRESIIDLIYDLFNYGFINSKFLCCVSKQNSAFIRW